MTAFAYVHARPNAVDARAVFYVGKGREARVRRVARVNKAHTAIVSKYGAANILIGALECSDDETAFALERGLIKCLRRSGVALVNATEGGEGGATLTGRKWVHRDGVYKLVLGADTPEFISEGWALGYKSTPKSSDVRRKIAAALKGRATSPEIRAKIGASGRGLKRSEATKRAISVALTGRERSRDHALAISASAKGRVVINNGTEERRVKAEDTAGFVAAGWSRGSLRFTCPHCGKTGGKSPMLARHVPYCKGDN